MAKRNPAIVVEALSMVSGRKDPFSKILISLSADKDDFFGLLRFEECFKFHFFCLKEKPTFRPTTGL